MTEKDSAYYEEVRRAVGRGAPAALLGTSTKSLERSLAKLRAVQEAEDLLASRDAPDSPASSSEASSRERGTGKSISRQLRKDRRSIWVAASTARRNQRGAKTQEAPDTEEQSTRSVPLPTTVVLDDGDVGYRGPTASAAAGITYRQLDYWARTGLVEPSIRAARGSGSGSQRLYGFRDILMLKVVKRLLDTGISMQQVRAAVQHLRDRGADLAQVTLMSDGVSVYECTSPDEVYDLLTGGQGVFGISLGVLGQEIAGELIELPVVRAEDGQIVQTDEELAARPPRRKRNNG
jgi:DNA-binding transcriptional MerR regulator